MDFVETTPAFNALHLYLREPDFEELAQGLAFWLPQMGPQDEAWAELARRKSLAEGVTPQRLMVDGLVALVDRNLALALRNLALMAAMVQEPTGAGLSEADLPWHGLRDLICARLQDPDAALAGAPALAWGLGLARQSGMPAKARILAEASGAAPARPAAKAVVASDTLLAWVQATALAEGLLGEAPDAQEMAEFLTLLDRLLAVRVVPKVMPEAMVQAIALLPMADLGPRLAAMQRGQIWIGHRLRVMFRAAQRHQVPAERLLRPLMVESEEPVIATSGGAAAGVTALVFCSRGKRPGAPFAAFDSHLAERGIRAIYLRDPEASAFVESPAALGEAQLAPLRALLAERPQDKLITIGFSLNALPAVAYGLALKARGILCYSGFVVSDKAERLALGDLRAADFDVPQEMDLRPWVAKTRAKIQLHMHYAEGAPADRMHAQAAARYKLVQAFEAPGHVSRALPAEMILRGTFGASLDRMLAAI